MNALDQIGALLVELELVRESQWQAACLQAGTTRRLGQGPLRRKIRGLV